VFTGRYERQLDPKGRVALPAEFRRQFEHQCFLTFGEEGCIDVFTPEAFKEMADDLAEKVRNGERPRSALRALMGNTFTVTVDGQGRVNLESQLREFAHLEVNSKVVVTGAYDRMEIWNTEAWARVDGAGTAVLRAPSPAAP